MLLSQNVIVYLAKYSSSGLVLINKCFVLFREAKLSAHLTSNAS